MKPCRRGGFSLIEALVAILLVAVLALILLPVLNVAVRRSRAAVCGANLRQLGVAFVTYAADRNGLMPDQPATDEDPKGTGLQWDAELGAVLGISRTSPERKGRTVFFCPESKKCTEDHFGRNYAYNQAIASNQDGARQRAAHLNPSQFLLLLEVQVLPGGRAWTLFGGKTNRMTASKTSALGSLFYPHGGGMNILFADGHVSRCLPETPEAADLSSVLPEGVLWLNR